MSEAQTQEQRLKQLKVKLGQIDNKTNPKDILPNPKNPYAKLSKEELEELTEDIRAKGILVPLIVKRESGKLVLVCGHNRREAAIKAGLPTVPFQEILTPLTPELEQDIMKSENDRRRGGRWSGEKKDAFILEHFGQELQTDKRGGDRKSSGRIKSDASPLIHNRVQEASKGAIGAAEAKKRIARLRKAQATQKPQPKQTERQRLKAEIKTLEGKIQALRETLAKLKAALKKA